MWSPTLLRAAVRHAPPMHTLASRVKVFPTTLLRAAPVTHAPRVGAIWGRSWGRCLSQSTNGVTQQNQSVSAPVQKEKGHAEVPSLSIGQQAMVTLNETGLTRGERPMDQIFASSLLAGAFLSWGGAMYVLLGGGTVEVMSDLPGLHKVMSAAIFPLGLSAIVVSGTDLLTGNMLYGSLPFISGDPRRTSEQKAVSLGRLLSISAAGNLVASCGMAFATWHLFAGTAMGTFAAAIATKKVAGTSMVIFTKACGANWLVNIAIFQATTVATTPGKMAMLWLPITSFVALGLEHCVANFYLLPLGALCGADISVLDMAHNLVPAILGNYCGAAFFVGYLHWKAMAPPRPKL